MADTIEPALVGSTDTFTLDVFQHNMAEWHLIIKWVILGRLEHRQLRSLETWTVAVADRLDNSSADQQLGLQGFAC